MNNYTLHFPLDEIKSYVTETFVEPIAHSFVAAVTYLVCGPIADTVGQVSYFGSTVTAIAHQSFEKGPTDCKSVALRVTKGALFTASSTLVGGYLVGAKNFPAFFPAAIKQAGQVVRSALQKAVPNEICCMLLVTGAFYGAYYHAQRGSIFRKQSVGRMQ